MPAAWILPEFSKIVESQTSYISMIQIATKFRETGSILYQKKHTTTSNKLMQYLRGIVED